MQAIDFGVHIMKSRRFILIAVVCTDKGNGMLFGGRRQSRDSEIYPEIVKMAEDSSGKLLLSHYSEPLFSDIPEFESLRSEGRVIVDDNFPDKASNGDICFFEDIQPGRYIKKTERLVIYNWNRRYPSDTVLDTDLKKFRKTDTAEFKGSSHEKIKRITYVPKKSS